MIKKSIFYINKPNLSFAETNFVCSCDRRNDRGNENRATRDECAARSSLNLHFVYSPIDTTCITRNQTNFMSY